MASPLFKRCRADGVPAFRLNGVHREYRAILIERIRSGSIALDQAGPCLCGTLRFMSVSEKDRFGLPFANRICVDCGLLSVNPKISAGSLPAYYADVYHPLICGVRPGVVIEDLVNEDQGSRIFSFMEGLIVRGRAKVCDVGAASGSTLLGFSEIARLRGISAELFACEYEENYLSHARHNGINAVRGGVESLAQFGTRFDIMILSHVFEHFYNPLEELGRIRGLLAEGGLLYIELPGVMDISGYGNDILQYLVHAHNYNFNLDSLSGVLAMEGFTLVKGDETVRAVFRMGGRASRALARDNHRRIIEYLNYAEQKRVSPSGVRRLKRLAWESYYRAGALLSPFPAARQV
ncbi:MAG: hypothetical protein A2V21_311615 [Deltaproteobacteria bacterium GWC2_55_46]|nr:MAG: hypothetical protein A2Z79_11375 [Deltaproteobacteria bacterium GWA2_55_82]OIJ74854.1 MAG: hypothetical protein A2V21_311615 [Deltaproteobacteria bacterium GWC2_55_46]